MIEGSGSISLTNESGCGSGRPKNKWILRIWSATLELVVPLGRQNYRKMDFLFRCFYWFNLCSTCDTLFFFSSSPSFRARSGLWGLWQTWYSFSQRYISCLSHFQSTVNVEGTRLQAGKFSESRLNCVDCLYQISRIFERVSFEDFFLYSQGFSYPGFHPNIFNGVQVHNNH